MDAAGPSLVGRQTASRGRGRRASRGRGRGGQNGHRGRASHPGRRRERTEEADEDDGGDASTQDGLGVNKIKAALRQTRRLLARESLKADARQEAERKLAALEGELESREASHKERKNATRYHKVRFFERQKLVRRIAKLKKRSDEDSEAAKELRDARLQLNYVLHFPMSQKYVALFPNSGPSPLDEGKSAADTRDAEGNTSAQRAQRVIGEIAVSMDKGELSAEPEEELDRRMRDSDRFSASDAPPKRPRQGQGSHANAGQTQQDGVHSKSTSRKKPKLELPKTKRKEEPRPAQADLADDDFFA